MFACREDEQESTGFIQFELLYGRTVRGPMQILKQLWTKELMFVAGIKAYMDVQIREQLTTKPKEELRAKMKEYSKKNHRKHRKDNHGIA